MKMLASALILAALIQQTVNIKVDVHLQQIVATVRDEAGKNIKGLRKEDFIVEDGGVPQTIVHFSDDPDAAISLGILIDASGSMGRMPGGSESGVASAGGITRMLLRHLKPDDEVALMTFAQNFTVRQTFTRDHRRVESALTDLQAAGTMDVLSALAPAVQQMHKAKYTKRALIVMTDAYFSGDINHAANQVYRAEVPLFTFAMRGVEFGPRVHSCTSACHLFETLPPPQFGISTANPFPNLTQPFLETMATESGGRSTIFEMDPRNTLQRINAALDDIAVELRGQYVLGYYPESAKSQAIRVRTVTPGYRVHFRREDQTLTRP